jgi:hypothetical protein
MQRITNGFVRLSFAASIAVAATVLVPVTASALAIDGGATTSYDWHGTGIRAFKLGPVGQQTCFLSGISGELYGDGRTPTNGSSLSNVHALDASAEIVPQAGFWNLVLKAGTGNGVRATATCISVTANRYSIAWRDNQPPVHIAAAPNRHCFLTGVWATSGFGGPWLGRTEDPHISLRQTAPNGPFLLDGVLTKYWPDLNFGGATVHCVDFVATSHWSFTLRGPSNDSYSATKTITLRDNFPKGAPVPIGDVGCFLTGIAGVWTSANAWHPPYPLGLYDGVFLTRDATVSPNWTLTASNDREGTVQCFR